MAYVRGASRLRRGFISQRFVDAVTGVLGPEFERREVSFSVENEARNLIFDERKMMRVVTNIARNARQAMSRRMVMWVLSDDAGGGLLFRIEDNGQGYRRRFGILYSRHSPHLKTTGNRPWNGDRSTKSLRTLTGLSIVHYADELEIAPASAYARRVHPRKRCHRQKLRHIRTARTYW